MSKMKEVISLIYVNIYMRKLLLRRDELNRLIDPR